MEFFSDFHLQLQMLGKLKLVQPKSVVVIVKNLELRDHKVKSRKHYTWRHYSILGTDAISADSPPEHIIRPWLRALKADPPDYRKF